MPMPIWELNMSTQATTTKNSELKYSLILKYDNKNTAHLPYYIYSLPMLLTILKVQVMNI